MPKLIEFEFADYSLQMLASPLLELAKKGLGKSECQVRTADYRQIVAAEDNRTQGIFLLFVGVGDNCLVKGVPGRCASSQIQCLRKCSVSLHYFIWFLLERISQLLQYLSQAVAVGMNDCQPVVAVFSQYFFDVERESSAIGILAKLVSQIPHCLIFSNFDFGSGSPGLKARRLFLYAQDAPVRGARTKTVQPI